MQYQHLPVTVLAGADADGRADLEQLGDFTGKLGRDHFQHHQGGAGLFQRQGFAFHARRAFLAASLHAVATQRVHRLRREADVGADRHAALDQEMHRFGHHLAAFELDHLRAGSEQAHGVAQGEFLRLLIAAEGHVGDTHRALRHVADALGVIDHLLHGHRQCRGLALQHVAQRIADQYHVDAAAILQRSEACIVAGEHGDLLAVVLHAPEFRQRDRLVAGEVGHGDQNVK